MQLPTCLSHVFLDQGDVLDGVIGAALRIHWLSCTWLSKRTLRACGSCSSFRKFLVAHPYLWYTGSTGWSCWRTQATILGMFPFRCADKTPPDQLHPTHVGLSLGGWHPLGGNSRAVAVILPFCVFPPTLHFQAPLFWTLSFRFS